MRTCILFLFVSTFVIPVKAQILKATVVSADSSKISKYKFRNAGEQEDYWAEELFKNNYKRQYYKKYKGPIIINGDTYTYNDKVLTAYTTPGLKAIFKQGILYPQLLSNDSLTISSLEELKWLNKIPKQKKFRFWLFRKGFSNPTVCFIELTNKNATFKTDILSFINGAKLTFFKEGWVII